MAVGAGRHYLLNGRGLSHGLTEEYLLAWLQEQPEYLAAPQPEWLGLGFSYLLSFYLSFSEPSSLCGRRMAIPGCVRGRVGQWVPYSGQAAGENVVYVCSVYSIVGRGPRGQGLGCGSLGCALDGARPPISLWPQMRIQ